ncbi:MAG: carboxypeptidase-like regulatory domain-containing protein [Acidobacteria bacterium]|nr:carboxypeptidase-like regulatory domain-containing protein [Acidobacteriota bacterium]
MTFAKRLACILVLSSSGMLWAQTGLGSIQGTVTDQSGALVPNAKIVAVHVETGNSFNTVSNQAGFFIFPSMQIGQYRVTAELAGMEGWQSHLVLQAGQNAAIAPVLKVGSTATEITVAGDVTPLLTTTSPTLATVVDRKRIEELPVNGRYFYNLLLITTPGLENGDYGVQNAQVYGLRDTTMQWLQDGAPMKDANTGAIVKRPPGLDTIQEYRVELSVPSAKYDSPATTVLSTRSGTNLWHGSLFYTGLNNGFGLARKRQDFYTTPPHYVRNEYGASLGGPLRIPHLYNGKDRTFFFAAWEAFHLRNGSTMSTSVPTPAMEQGDFSELINAQGQRIALYDPWSTASRAQNYSRVPYPGNIIPTSKRSPFAAYFFSVFPQANQPTINPLVSANWFGPNPSKQDDWTLTTRVDHRLSDKDQIFGRYTISDSLTANRRTSGNTSPITSDNYWNFQTNTPRTQTAAFTWNHMFGPSSFMETTVTAERDDWRFDLGGGVITDNVSSQLGVPNIFGYGGAPNLSNMGFSLSGHGTIPRAEDTKPIAVQQNFTKIWGNHQTELGWRFQRMFLDVMPDRPGEGAISFDSQATGLYDTSTGTAFNSKPLTGYNLANFFLGVAGSYTQQINAPKRNLRSNAAAAYVQDNWRVTRDFTLNIGMRYDYLQPLLDANGNNTVFDFANHAIVRQETIEHLMQRGGTTQSMVDQFAAIGAKFETPEQAGISGDLVHVGQLNFSPRVGFAYKRNLGGRLVVIRGGFGEYRYTLGARLWNAQAGNPPKGALSYNINSAAKSPDGLANYGLRSVPAVIAGTNSAINAIDPNAANSIARGVGVVTFASDLPTSLAREWNLTLETEISHNTLLRAAYVGTQGRNLDETIYRNGQASNFVYYTETGMPLPTGPYANVIRRDYDQTTYGDIQVFSHAGYSNYNGIQVEVQRRFNSGLGFQWYYVMSNALYTGSGKQIAPDSSKLPDPVTFLPGSVPSDFDAYNRFYNYRREPSIPKHRVNWNMLYDLPFGRGKKLYSHAGGVMNRIVGGWQLAAHSSMSSRYITLPTGSWGPTGDVQIYDKQYPVEDCRSGPCIRGYLWYNGYIPTNQINAHNAAGQCIGVCGVPSNYQPSNQPIWAWPANPNRSDPNYALYGTNNVYIPMKNGKQQRIAYDTGLNPWRNQYIPGPWAWTVNSSLFKVIPLNERLKLRINMDFFNVLNMPGTPMPNATTGIISLQNSNNGPRQLQWTARVSW